MEYSRPLGAIIVEAYEALKRTDVVELPIRRTVPARYPFIKVRLISTNGDFKEMQFDQVEILGRVILSGKWERH